MAATPLNRSDDMGERSETRSVYDSGSGGARADEAAAAAEVAPDCSLRARQEALLDEGVQETFPASDPVAVVRLI
jgi:hypothetical protein